MYIGLSIFSRRYILGPQYTRRGCIYTHSRRVPAASTYVRIGGLKRSFSLTASLSSFFLLEAYLLCEYMADGRHTQTPTREQEASPDACAAMQYARIHMATKCLCIHIRLLPSVSYKCIYIYMCTFVVSVADKLCVALGEVFYFFFFACVQFLFSS